MSDTTAVNVTQSAGILDAFASPFRWTFSVFETIRVAMAQHDAYVELNRLSDEELARRGLAREDIARHVFDTIS